jgi:heme-degrading monooxygenase HmoA
MYIAMNRFKVLKDRTSDFESTWLNREIHLHKVPGFISFHLLKGPEREDHVLYSSHTMWRSYADSPAKPPAMPERIKAVRQLRE